MAIIPTKKYSDLPVDELPLLDLMANMANSIIGSNEVKDWCNINYGQDCTVFSGSDPDNPPKKSSYPLIEVYPLSDNHGRDIDQFERSIGITCGLYDNSTETVAYEGLTIMSGVLKLEEFFRLVLAAAASADLAGGYISEIIAERDTEALHPFFLLGAEIKIVKPI